MQVVQGGLEAPSGVKIASMGKRWFLENPAKAFWIVKHVSLKPADGQANPFLPQKTYLQLSNNISSAGDTEDLMLLAVVAVTVGYGLRPEDLIEV